MAKTMDDRIKRYNNLFNMITDRMSVVNGSFNRLPFRIKELVWSCEDYKETGKQEFHLTSMEPDNIVLFEMHVHLIDDVRVFADTAMVSDLLYWFDDMDLFVFRQNNLYYSIDYTKINSSSYECMVWTFIQNGCTLLEAFSKAFDIERL